MPDLTKRALHILSSDVPLPANYGGMIDVFYTIKQLSEAGVSIYLHCFQYGRAEVKELEHYCKKVWYYPRKTGVQSLSLRTPYMVYSRRDDHLLPNLLSVDAPILFEGIHCCYLLSHPALHQRKKILRNQNVEQQYYALLAEREHGFFKKIYYKMEAGLLKRFESKLYNADHLVPISQKDCQFFEALYPGKAVHYLAGFHPYEQVISKEGKGTYCLYHGNLGHPENIEAALYLIHQVFNDLDIPLIIAGRTPSREIIEACDRSAHIKLIANPDEETMNKLIEAAQIQVLPTFQASGLKLKLLYALYAGRFVLVNKAMLYGTGLEDSCITAEAPADFKRNISTLMLQYFSQDAIDSRIALLNKQYNNKAKTQRLLSVIDT